MFVIIQTQKAMVYAALAPQLFGFIAIAINENMLECYNLNNFLTSYLFL